MACSKRARIADRLADNVLLSEFITYEMKRRGFTGWSVNGGQGGDEGKGKWAAFLAGLRRVRLIVRLAGSNNAGHTVVVVDPTTDLEQVIKCHVVPAGIVAFGGPKGVDTRTTPDDKPCCAFVASNVYVNPLALFKEVQKQNNDLPKGWFPDGKTVESYLRLDARCSVVLPIHTLMDTFAEEARGDAKIGTTKSGVSPVAAARALRLAKLLRIFLLPKEECVKAIRQETQDTMELFNFNNCQFQTITEQTNDFVEAVEDYLYDWLGPLIVNNSEFVTTYKGETGYEGPQSYWLDIHGGPDYPNMTASTVHCGVVGLVTDPTKVMNWAVIKACYNTKVGSGKLPLEFSEEKSMILQERGNERGTSTGRTRRCGAVDLTALRSANCGYGVLSKADIGDDTPGSRIQVIVGYKNTKTGVVYERTPDDINDPDLEPIVEEYENWSDTDDITQCTSFDELPKALQNFSTMVRDKTGVHIAAIGNGRVSDAFVFVPPPPALAA